MSFGIGAFSVDGIHQLLQFLTFLIGERWRGYIVLILKNGGEHVFDRLPFRVAHCESRCIDAFGHQLVFQKVAAAVSFDDAANLPELDVIEKLTTRDAYFAHEQLVDVVGGGQFFLPSSFESSFSSSFGRA